ncbi:MAG: hypothetical protein ACHQ50_06330 [Fimbriimonadales bacterium]
MTEADFRAAAAKGQGRALAALRGGEVHPSLHDLRRLILRWPGYDDDWLCEWSRGWYSVELITASGFEPDSRTS